MGLRTGSCGEEPGISKHLGLPEPDKPVTECRLPGLVGHPVITAALEAETESLPRVQSQFKTSLCTTKSNNTRLGLTHLLSMHRLSFFIRGRAIVWTSGGGDHTDR